MTTLSPLAQRIYDVLVERMTTVDYVPLHVLESAIEEQTFGIGGVGWTALSELNDAGLIEILRDFRYQLTPRAWRSLLSNERERATKVINKVLTAWRDGATDAQMNTLMRELAGEIKE